METGIRVRVGVEDLGANRNPTPSVWAAVIWLRFSSANPIEGSYLHWTSGNRLTVLERKRVEGSKFREQSTLWHYHTIFKYTARMRWDGKRANYLH